VVDYLFNNNEENRVNITFMIQQLAFMLPCLVCLSWAVTLSISWKTNVRAQNVWAVASLMAAINAFYWTYLGTTSPGEIYTYVGRVGSFTQTGFFCILYFFYWSLIDNRPFTRKQYTLFIPALLLGMINLIVTSMMGHNKLAAFLTPILENEGKGTYASNIEDRLTFIHYIVGGQLGGIIDILLIQCLLIIMVVRWFSYRNKRKSFFTLSGEQHEKQSWAIFSGLFVFLFFMLIYSIGEYFYYIEDYIPFYILFILQGSLFFYIGYQVFYLNKQPEPLTGEPEQTDKQEITGSVEALLPLFNKLMNKEKIYLNSDLRIDEVALRLHVDKSQVFNLIEWIEPSGFATYINRKRIEYAQKLEQDNPQMTQKEIAGRSGFRNTASFVKAFRKYRKQSDR